MGGNKADNNQIRDGASGSVDNSKPLRTIKLPHYEQVPKVKFDPRFRIEPNRTRLILYFFCEHLKNKNDPLMRIPAFFVDKKVEQICKDDGAFRNMIRRNNWKGSNEYPHGIFFETWERWRVPKEFKPLANIKNLITFPLVLGGGPWRGNGEPGAVRVVRGKNANGEVIHDIIYHSEPDNKMKMATLQAGVVVPPPQCERVPNTNTWK